MNHPIEKENKVPVLLAALQERYTAQHNIRERVQSIGIWAIGLLLATGGWIIQNKVELTCSQKTLYVIGILAAFSVLRFKYLKDLYNGFKTQQRVAVRLEKALGLFTPEFFDNEKDPIYPKSWEGAGTENGGGKFFDTTYVLLYVGVIFLLFTVIFSNNPHQFRQKYNTVQRHMYLDTNHY